MTAHDSPVVDVGVVTVSFHSENVLPELFRSLDGSTGVRARGIVADNASSPAVADLAGASGFAYLALDNPGYGAAANAAVRALDADIEWILVVNPDVSVDADAIRRMVDRGASEAGIGVVGPMILDGNGSVYPSARDLPSLRTGIGHALFGSIWRTNPWTQRYLRQADLDARASRDAGWLSGACLLLHREAFAAIRGFDERYFMYFEDVDLGMRMARAGWRNVWEPTAIVRHTGGTSTSVVAREMIDAHHRSAMLFVARRYPGPLLAPVRVAIALGLRVRGAVSARSAAREARPRR